MKTASLLILILAAIVMTPTPTLALTLDELIDKYGQATATLHEQYKAGIKADADAYLKELEEAREIAKNGGSTLVTSAIDNERKIVQEAGELPKDPSASLPRQIHTARRKYVRAVTRAIKIRLGEEDDLKKKFVRGLASIERRAKLEKNDAELARVAAERAKLAGAPDVDKGFGKNLLRNADFSAGPLGPGVPPEWDNHDGKAVVETEDAKRLLFLPGKAISQLVQLPEGTKRIEVSLRLRAPDLKALDIPGAHKAGVHLYLEDAAGKLIKSSDIEITRKERKWKELEADVRIPDGVTQVRLMLFREGIEGPLHADNLSLQALAR